MIRKIFESTKKGYRFITHQLIIWYNTDRPQDKLKEMTSIEFRDSFQFN